MSIVGIIAVVGVPYAGSTMTEVPVPPVVVMGVAGSGKSVIGTRLAASLDVPFIEGDALHPPENVALMARGQPLTDEDRFGWLEKIGEEIAATISGGSGAVTACSALKRRYRDQLRRHVPSLLFVHLVIDPATARRRVQGRRGHFMPSSLVESQFATLEPLQPEEAGLAMDGTRPVEDIVAAAVAFLRNRATQG